MNANSDDTPVSSDIAPNLPRTRGRVPGATKRVLRKAERVKKPPRERRPRKRPPLYTQSDDVLERIIPLASEILQLVQLRIANGGTLPYGELKLAAQRLAPYRYVLLRMKAADDNDAEEEEEEYEENCDGELKPMHKNGVGFLVVVESQMAWYTGRD